jgi:hypothetical protein
LSISPAIIKPTFISGGVQEDRIREIEGHLSARERIFVWSEGAFKDGPISGGVATSGSNNGSTYSDFIASLVVPTGLDNAPTNVSMRFWRRVPDPA